MGGVMYFAPAVFLADEVAHAAPIVDPRAPIPFQPTVTQSAGGIPVINVTAPNPQGLSANPFQRLSAGPEGLIFNNSLTGGTSLIGGAVGANPNLSGRTASTILAQVTSQGAQYASMIAGPLEIFGNPASLIIANPNGVSIPGGTALTSLSNLTLTTGVPQFIDATGAPTDFAHAGALAYSVSSGHIDINGAPGVNGPGPGIDGTVSNLDLIAQTLSINAPLKADQRVNVIAGNQLVTPVSTGAGGTSYATAPNGTANTAAAMGLPPGSVVIDASQFGSITAGEIFIAATPAGPGVNLQGALAGTAGNVSVAANGDIVIGPAYAAQNVSLTSAGSTTITGTNLAGQNYTVNANGDITAPGSVSAGQDATLHAGGNLTGSGPLNVANDTWLSAGGDRAFTGAIQTGNNLTADAGGNEHVIVKLDAKRPTQVPAFDQAKETIRQQLEALALQKASAQLVSAQLKGASIQQ